MENLVLEAIKIVNPIQLALIALIVFYFYNRLDKKIEGVRQESRQDFGSLKQDFKELRQETKEMETRINQELKTLNQRIDSLYQLIVSVFKKAS